MEDEARTILRAAPPPTRSARPGASAEPRRSRAAQLGDRAGRRRRPGAGAKRVLLIIGGGIAAYKSLDLIRRLKERGAAVRCILTAAAQQFITPLAAGALAGGRVFTDLFDAATEFDVGHIRLARETDLVIVAPATADLMAKMAGGHADDLACAVLLAADRQVLIAPAMNPQHVGARGDPAQPGAAAADGVAVVGPNAGEMAEAGEAGSGRMAEPLEIVAAAWPLLGEAGATRCWRARA